jgi:hypothetical protein
VTDAKCLSLMLSDSCHHVAVSLSVSVGGEAAAMHTCEAQCAGHAAAPAVRSGVCVRDSWERRRWMVCGAALLLNSARARDVNSVRGPVYGGSPSGSTTRTRHCRTGMRGSSAWCTRTCGIRVVSFNRVALKGMEAFAPRRNARRCPAASAA